MSDGVAKDDEIYRKLELATDTWDEQKFVSRMNQEGQHESGYLSPDVEDYVIKALEGGRKHPGARVIRQASKVFDKKLKSKTILLKAIAEKKSEDLDSELSLVSESVMSFKE